MIEQYNVKFNYLKPDGYWCIGATEIVSVNVTDEKCNHHLASNVIKSKYPNCNIVNVKYI